MELETLQYLGLASDVESSTTASQDCLSEHNEGVPDTPVFKSGVSLVGLVLDGQYQFAWLLRRDNHADVYSIVCIPSPSEYLEARVYDLGGLPPKLRQYRLRSIKRLSSRTVFETRWEGKTIIVYKTGSKITQKEEAGENKEVLPTELPSSKVTGLGLENTETKPINKTSHHRESARIRQLERRQSNRRSKRKTKVSEPTKGGSPPVYTTVGSTTVEVEVGIYDRLYDAYMAEQLNPKLQGQLLGYLSASALEFEDFAEMEAFMKVKQREVLFLQRQRKKLPEALRTRKHELGRILQQQSRHHQNSAAFLKLQYPLRDTRQRLNAVREVRDILRDLIEKVDGDHRALRRRVSLTSKMKTKIESLGAVTAEQTTLKRKMDTCGKCLGALVPGTGPFIQMQTEIAAVKKDMERFETRNSNALAMLRFLQVEYESLLRSSAVEAPQLESSQQPQRGFWGVSSE